MMMQICTDHSPAQCTKTKVTGRVCDDHTSDCSLFSHRRLHNNPQKSKVTREKRDLSDLTAQTIND